MRLGIGRVLLYIGELEILVGLVLLAFLPLYIGLVVMLVGLADIGVYYTVPALRGEARREVPETGTVEDSGDETRGRGE